MAGNPRIDELRKKLDKEPGSRLFAQLAEELRKDGDLEDAIQVAREGLQKHSNYPSARMTLGRALFDTGDRAAARSEFELVLKGAPDNILASRLLAECLESLGDVPGAIGRYKKTLALAPGDKQVLARLEELEKGGGAAAPAAVAVRGPAPDATLVPQPSPIRVVEVDTPMELEQTHERATSLSAASAPAVSPGPPVAPSSPPPTSSAPPPIPVSAADEDFELERPYEPPRPAVSAPVAPPARPAPPQPPRQAESMMEFEFEPGPTGSTIPFAPPPAPAPSAAEGAPPAPVPSVAAPPPMPEPARPPMNPPPVAAAPEPPPVAPAPPPVLPTPPPAAFVPPPEPPPAPPAVAVKTVEVPWSAPPPPRAVPPPASPAPAPSAPVRQPEAPPAPESASGELTSATLAELYFKQGFPDKAIEVYRQLIDREPDNDRLRRRLGELQDLPAAPASRRVALERTIAKLEGMLAAIKKG